MILFLIILEFILILGSQLAPHNKFNDDFLSLKNTKRIQGFCALLIITHHFSQVIVFGKDSAGYLDLFCNKGYLFVCVFFFFSGYGLIKSYYTKKDYLKNFLINRLPVVIIPLYLINTILTIIVLFTGKNFYKDKNPLSYGMNTLFYKITSFSGITLMNSSSWYIVTITLFYICFYFAFKNRKNNSIGFLIMGIFLTLYITVCMFAGIGPYWFQGDWWYNSCLILLIGMIFAKYENTIIKFMKKYYILLFPISLIGSIVTINKSIFIVNNVTYYNPGLSGKIDALYCLGIQTVSEIFFLAFILILTMKLSFKNKILDFLGSMSLEIYLVHRVFLLCLHSNYIYIENKFIYLALVYLLSILSSILLHKIDQGLLNLIRRKSNN
ncbi:acyltransferase [uncultured Clostridium sp.]|uniref:acyltransferase family protein n=1 Tax=uncultured Clostridium sp. TaxID=59620 RepID=UPI0025DD3847|nr:acyltransferase [uncultured Clostridium sp.]